LLYTLKRRRIRRKMIEKIKICPICKKHYFGYGATSRKDNKTEICSSCGVKDAMEEYRKYNEKTKENDIK
jgi:RNA polymerase subunit RPABC4/transcription elongation factor Spt4